MAAIRGALGRPVLVYLVLSLAALAVLGPHLVSLAYNNLGRIELARTVVQMDRRPMPVLEELVPHLDQSEALLKEALRWQPGRLQFSDGVVRLHATRGEIYRRLGAWDDAIISYEKALEVDANLVSANEKIAEILLNNKPRDKPNLDKAITHLERAVFLSPKNEYARMLLGQALWTSGQRDKAIAALVESVSLAPTGYSWSVLASYYFEVGEWDGAIAAFENALALEPGRSDAWFQLGETYKKIGAQEKSLRAWRQVVELTPNSEMGRLARSKLGP